MFLQFCSLHVHLVYALPNSLRVAVSGLSWPSGDRPEVRKDHRCPSGSALTLSRPLNGAHFFTAYYILQILLLCLAGQYNRVKILLKEYFKYKSQYFSSTVWDKIKFIETTLFGISLPTKRLWDQLRTVLKRGDPPPPTRVHWQIIKATSESKLMV